jgi:hypothetical protein
VDIIRTACVQDMMGGMKAICHPAGGADDAKGPLPADLRDFRRQTLDPAGRGPFRNVMVETEGN